ncbi:hypothetical protein [Reichenbachiella sp.]|uniref:hypothetical protein n=1 Tax=Reichenbachiella sp. TaxID=2184521 RepID=UPI003263AF20
MGINTTIIDGDYRLFVKDLENRSQELYDILSIPGEGVNIISTHPARVKKVGDTVG